jgi:hypothetical protein
MTKEFRFDLKAKRTRLTDAALMGALQSAAEAIGDGYFSSTQYDDLPGKRPHSATIIERFGSLEKNAGTDWYHGWKGKTAFAGTIDRQS